MKLKNFTKKKGLAFGLAFGVAAGAGGIAAAYFSANGTGSGSGTVGSANQALKITQVGASYYSLLASSSPDPYGTSMCSAGCSNPSEIGGKITLAHMTPKYTPTYAHVTSVTVALVNFGAAKTQMPVTLNLFHSPNVSSYSFTQNFTIAGGSATNQVVTNVTFNLAGKHVFLYKTSAYGIHMTSTETSGVNIARVTSNDVTVGTSIGGTWTGTGNTPVSTNAAFAGYVPAVQFNVIGGVVPPLFPGSPAQPVQYAITNPNTASVHVGTITSAIKAGGTTNKTVYGAAACLRSWFTLANPAYAYTANVPSGTTIITSGSTTLQMTTSNSSQNACEGHSVPLTFSSN